MIVFQVHHFIKPEMVEAYKTAALANAAGAALEPGIIRFEVYQDQEEPTHFSLFEIYEDQAARDAHFETEHFLAWADVYRAAKAKDGHGHHFDWHRPD